jgi:hypothetical protein
VHRLVSPLVCILLLAGMAMPQPPARADDPPGFETRIEAPEDDVLSAVAEVAQDQIIHGTYSYDKERILYGARSAKEARVFNTWKGSGRVFYKVANNVLSPRYFKDTNDIGTISVRYVVQSIDNNATAVQIDAVFVDARNGRHPSLGNVESSEYTAIQQHLRTIQEKRQATEDKPVRAADASAPATPLPTTTTLSINSAPPAARESVPDLQEHISALRHEVELQVKEQGAQLKSAPFHGAATLQSLPAQADVLIVVLTPYWYGVETEDGHRGWIHHSQLEPLP